MAVGVEGKLDVQLHAAGGVVGEAPDEPLEGRGGDAEEGLEGDEGPLQARPLGEAGGRPSRDEGARVEAARHVVQGAPRLAEAAGDLRGGELREVAHGGEAPPEKGAGEAHLGGEARKGKGREEGGLAPRGDDDGGVGEPGRHLRRELARRDAAAGGEPFALRRGDEGAAEVSLLGEVAMEPVQVDVDDALATVLDAR